MAGRRYRLGSIWSVPDKKIHFPFSLNRTFHDKRLIVIAENSDYNFDANTPTIFVAPLSSQVDMHCETDILVQPDELNKLDKPSYIRMRASQFIDKSQLENYIGQVNDNVKSDITVTFESFITNN